MGYPKSRRFVDMSKESSCLWVPKKHGQRTIVLADKSRLRDKELEVQTDANYIFVPLVRSPTEEEISLFRNEVSQVRVKSCMFQMRRKQHKTIDDALAGLLSSDLLASLPKALDVVGDIAIIEIPPELRENEKLIGEAILKTHRNIKTVLSKAGSVSGTYRLRGFKIIAGEPRTLTVHKEYGCRYQVDVAKAYFSPRLSHEHERVGSLVGEDETVVDMFAGVGPFSVLIGKKHPSVKVYALDINPEAFVFLKKNVLLNRVQDNVVPLFGDARQIVRERLAGVANRVIMNLPESAIEFASTACAALKPNGGVLHFYGFVRLPSSMEALRNCFAAEVEKAGRRVERFLSVKAVRETGPYEQQVVLDAFVS